MPRSVIKCSDQLLQVIKMNKLISRSVHIVNHFKKSLSKTTLNLVTETPHHQKPFQYDEPLISINKRGRSTLFQLNKDAILPTSDGIIPHNSIVGGRGAHFKTNSGSHVFIRRPSLEEYVLLMPRGPVVSYPKDIWAVLGLLDVGPGSRVLEAGSGSGSLTLHLSRAVADSGKVHSFELKDKHLETARGNVSRWGRSRDLGGGEDFTRNIDFYNCSVEECDKILGSETVDGVVLDMVDCRRVMKSALSVMKENAIAVIYCTNISQAIQLNYHLELHKNKLPPHHIESMLEVLHRHWLVQPASQKRKHVSQLYPKLNKNNDEYGHERSQDIAEGNNSSLPDPVGGDIESSSDPLSEPFGDIPCYIARPEHIQDPHTTFLIKLRRR
ncbi:PREDICTED: uncharacterized protein LOC100635102 isoform X1 [Amphimedon queenslandica]|uniref:tRNA (adenine(58)-N(1))-methyltransferase n=1 Tax=Amphimedon queenslandica TaxID=400682 RepID=A0AAN0IC28_AMPQE|nr:PREDICTED: uncharacterized protein LOC100635102 isoform X1 [Amphimedon queenslandica]|eukprot:XP_003385084.2 PREDICTED: uncharacterized protein LOC100635102 isoform X1 [Amphimedon queenslandica]